MNYAREEYIDNPAIGCDPNNLSLPLCPNDMSPLFSAVAVIDTAGNIEGVFNFEALSHSLVEDTIAFDPGLLPRPITDFAIGPIQAYLVDNGSGQPQFLDQMNWTDGSVDTFQFQFVPEPLSLALLATSLAIIGARSRKISLPRLWASGAP